MGRGFWLFLSGIVVILLGLFGYLYIRQSSNSQLQVSPSPVPSALASPSTSASSSSSPATSVSYCTPQDLEALVSLSPGAGNIYGTFTLKNISSKECQVQGGEFISVSYDQATVKNITITHMGQTQAEPFILSPNTTLYSQVHYPNGPQCQSIGLNPTPVTFAYQISPQNSIIFKNPQDSIQQIVQTCKTQNDLTEIQIWNMSTQPITPLAPESSR